MTRVVAPRTRCNRDAVRSKPTRLLDGVVALVAVLLASCGPQEDKSEQALSLTDQTRPVSSSIGATSEDAPQEARPLGAPEAGIGWPDEPPPKTITEAWRGKAMGSVAGHASLPTEHE
jgi:hypothetical protein